MSERNLSSAQFGHGQSGKWVQLPMLMTAPEIRKGFQALDGDREGHSSWIDWGDSGDRTSSSNPQGLPKRRRGGSLENDDQLFDRKYDEAGGHSPYPRELAKRLMSEGVRNPVSLQDPANSDRGMFGKPEILGGHHRVAVYDKDAPERLMPVSFSDDVYQAQDTLGDKY